MKKFYVYYAKRMGLHIKSPERVNLQTDYNSIGPVEANDLEDLFRKMNVVDGTELPLKLRCRSMCSGDVAVDETGRGYFCAMIGWEAVATNG